ncbi:hypothetical protein [Frigoriglobus tundricola]|uniref:hypothetical protein n=1 Tax=Frigoriglobus tundricola TaxID=2774151 RepID=UPI00148ECCA9|nr:hypothetical protein [Frigoriglobus tundricola]
MPPESNEPAPPKLTGAQSAPYLIMLSDSASDLPLALLATPDEAVDYAREVKACPDAYANAYYSRIGVDARSMYWNWISIAAVEFDGSLATRKTVLFELD